MAHIGEALRKARETSGMTIEQTAARLRMRAMLVDAMENEQWRSIGEAVYVRGFLKNYANLLGLDAAPLLAQLSNDYDYREPMQSQGTSTVASSSASQSQAPWYPWVLGAMTTAAVVLVVVVVWNVVALFAFGPGKHPLAGASTARLSETQQSGNSVGGASITTSSSSDKTAQQRGLRLRLEITQNCWLSVTVDGRRVLYGTLPAGAVREFSGVHQISLRAGNAGGVIAIVDGRDLGTLGTKGQVKDRTFAVNRVLHPETQPHD